MGGAVQVRTELDQIAARLQDDGLAPAAGPEERQCHLWRELVGSEGKLQAASQELQTLRTQQAGEMKEVSCDVDPSYPRSQLLHKATVRRFNWQREDAPTVARERATKSNKLHESAAAVHCHAVLCYHSIVLQCCIFNLSVP